METDQAFGARLRQKRYAATLTQTALAEAVGGLVTQATVSAWEQGRTCPDPSFVPVLARALKMTEAEFVLEIGRCKAVQENP